MTDATYVYGVVKTKPRTRATLGRAKLGMPGGARARVLPAEGGYVLVVSSVPLGTYAASAVEPRLRDLEWVAECGAAHERVVEHASKLGTVVPMKLFTIFTSDERAVSHVTKTKRELERIVRRIEGCDEWGLRILDVDSGARAREASLAREKPTSGRSFLERKRAQSQASKRAALGARSEIDALYETLEKSARRAHKRPAPSRELAGRVMLDAVFLVPRTAAKKLTRTIATAAKALSRGGYHVTLTGPWPAYSFIGASA